MENTEVLREKCNLILKNWVGEALINKWWASSLTAFNNRTPEEVFNEDPNKVYIHLISLVNSQYIH